MTAPLVNQKELLFRAISKFCTREIASDEALYNLFLRHCKGQAIEGTGYVHNFIRSIQKTNFFVPNIKALSFRLDPEIICREKSLEHMPFAIFYIFGDGFFGFH